MTSINYKIILFYISIPIALILLIISGAYLNQKEQIDVVTPPEPGTQENTLSQQTPLFNQDYQLNGIINYIRSESVFVDMGSGSSSIQTAQNLTFYVLDKAPGHHTSMILKIDDEVENKSDYFAFTISPTGQILSFQYPSTTKEATVQLGRSSIFQFTPSLVQSLFNSNQPVYEKMGDMYVKFHRVLSYNTNNTVSVSRRFDPSDIINATSASKNFSFIDFTIFNKTNGIMIYSYLQQTYFLENQLGQFTTPNGTANSSQNVAPPFNLTTVVDIIKKSEQNDFTICQQALFNFKMQGNLVTETDILSSQTNNNSNSRLLAASSTSTNTNNATTTQEKKPLNITHLKNISLFQTDLFGCNFSLVFNLKQQQLPHKGRSLYIFSLFVILGDKEKQIIQKRLFSASSDMTPNKTKSRILNLLGLPQQSSQRKLRNLAKLEIDDVFNLTQIVSPQTNLRIKLIINTDFNYDLDILNFIENVENQRVDPETNKTYNKSILTQPWRKLENRYFNSSFDINLNISMQANFKMKVPGGNIVLNTTANLLNATAQLFLMQQFNFTLSSLKFIYQVAFGKVVITPYLNTKSCIKKVCTELSTPQSPYTLFDGTSSGEQRKEEKIKEQEKQEYEESNEDNEEDEEENNNNNNSTNTNENNSTNTTSNEPPKSTEDQEEEELISQGGNGQPELKPENEEQNQKKTCDIKDNKCYSDSPCGCQIFPQVTKQNSCPDFKKGLENGCDLQEPYVDFDFIKCNIKSCNIPNILVSQDTCQAKQDASFKIGMDFEISDIDPDQINALANKTGINTTTNIINLINNYSQKLGMDDPNMKSVNSSLLSDQETNLINQVEVERNVKSIQVFFDKMSQEATQGQSKLFNQLPRSIRTVIFYFYFQFSDVLIKSNQFLTQVNEFILLQKWKQAIDLCYQDQASCVQFNLNSTISLMRFACTMCNQTSQIPADVVFIMDASGSVSSSDFEKERQFVINLTQSLMINNSEINVGIIQFSTTSTIESYLDSNMANILKTLKDLSKISGSTYTDLAFKDSYTIFKQSKNQLIKRMLFVLTDGQSNGGSWTSILADLKNFGINIYSVGIGSGVNINELKTFATDSENVFMVSSFSVLNKIQSTLQKEVCFGTIPLNSTFQVTTIQQKAGTYSYFSFEYNPLDGKTIIIDLNITNNNTNSSTNSSSNGTNSSSSGNSTQQSCSEEQQDDKSKTNNGNHFGQVKQNVTTKAYFSESEQYPNEFNNDGSGYLSCDGKIKISKEKEGYNSSSNSNSKNKRIMQTTKRNLYVSIISEIDQTIKVTQQNSTQQIVPCSANCTVCNAMGSICYICENQTFLYNGQCYYQNDKLQQITWEPINNKEIVQVSQEIQESYKINNLSLIGLIFSSIYLSAILGYLLYMKIIKKNQISPMKVLNQSFDEKRVPKIDPQEIQNNQLSLTIPNQDQKVLY